MPRFFLPTAALSAILSAIPGYVSAWDLGTELRGGGAAVLDPFAPPLPGYEDRAGTWNLSCRLMATEEAPPLRFEGHLLAGLAGSSRDALAASPPASSPFRVLDLEKTWTWADRTALAAELDRLSVTWEGPGVRAVVGRQAVTWGNAYYFNPLDLFGAFAVTETYRAFKPGLDAAAVTLPFADFSEAAVVAIPRADDRPGSAAARVLFPAGKAIVTLAGGELAGDRVAGAGLEGEISGTRLYAQALWTEPEAPAAAFGQLVLGGERQVDETTHLLIELARNGWGAAEEGDLAALAADPRFLQGRVPALGRWEGAVSLTRQLTPLLTGTGAVIGNLADGSVLLHGEAGYSLSNLSDLRAGFFLGLGKRRDGPLPRSEWGTIPFRAYAEVGVSL